MRFALIPLLALALGCATAKYDPSTGESSATAFGKSTATASADGVIVEGGPLSDGIVGVFKPLAEAVRGFFGGTPPNVVVNVPDQVIVREVGDAPDPSPEP